MSGPRFDSRVGSISGAAVRCRPSPYRYGPRISSEAELGSQERIVTLIADSLIATIASHETLHPDPLLQRGSHLTAGGRLDPARDSGRGRSTDSGHQRR